LNSVDLDQLENINENEEGEKMVYEFTNIKTKLASIIQNEKRFSYEDIINSSPKSKQVN
jgi:hypothetical protein